MSIDPRVARAIAALLLVALVSVASFADTIRLTNGSIIKGRIASFGGGKFVVVIGEGSRRRELTFDASEVESISFDEERTAADPNRKVAYNPPATEPAAPKHRVVVTEGTASPSTEEPTPPKPRVVVKEGTVPTVSSAPPVSSTPREKMKPIEWRVKVLADNTANGWTNSGFVVKKGQRIRIEGDGTISLGRSRTSSPSGLPELEDHQKLLKAVATGALIAVIGDDNNDFIYIGAEREFTATRDGALFLGVNEGHLDDNSGFYDVKIAVNPE